MPDEMRSVSAPVPYRLSKLLALFVLACACSSLAALPSSQSGTATSDDGLKRLRLKLKNLSHDADPELSENLLKTLRRKHPRLLVDDEQLKQVRRQIKTDPTAKSYYTK